MSQAVRTFRFIMQKQKTSVTSDIVLVRTSQNKAISDYLTINSTNHLKKTVLNKISKAD